MKSIDLVKCLNSDEIQKLKEHLIQKGLNELFPIFDYFISSPASSKPEKSVLFSLSFQETYSSKLDYKIRHLLRLFNQEIEQFIIGAQIKKRVHLNLLENINPVIAYLDFLLERKAKILFEKEWNKYLKKARSKKMFLLERDLIQTYFNYVTNHQEEKIKYYSELLNILEEGIINEKNNYLEVTRTLEHQIGFLNYTAMFTGQSLEEKTYKDYSFISEEIKNESLFRYLQLLAQSFYERNHKKRIPIFKELLQLHNEVAQIRPELSYLKRDYNNWLGHCYYFLKDYKTSCHYFEASMEIMEKKSKWLRLENVFNYISILTKSNDFSTPISIYEKYKKKIKKNERVKYRFGYIIAICLIFEGRASEAWDLIPEDINNRPQNDFYYSRFIMAMIYFEEQRFELFEREVTNIYQTTHYKTPEEILWLDVSKIFKKMERVYTIPDNEKEKQKILVEIDEMDKNHPMLKDVLPVKWLISKLS